MSVEFEAKSVHESTIVPGAKKTSKELQSGACVRQSPKNMRGARRRGESVFVPIVQRNQKHQNTKTYLAKQPKGPIIEEIVAA